MRVKTISTVETVQLNNASLTPNTLYWVVGFDDSNYRVLDDNDEPILFPKYLFEVIDNSYPKYWIRKSYEDEYFVDPPELAEDDFYERYFEGDNEAINVFKEYCLRNLKG